MFQTNDCIIVEIYHLVNWAVIRIIDISDFTKIYQISWIVWNLRFQALSVQIYTRKQRHPFRHSGAEGEESLRVLDLSPSIS